jgi:hypothetical protein
VEKVLERRAVLRQLVACYDLQSAAGVVAPPKRQRSKHGNPFRLGSGKQRPIVQHNLVVTAGSSTDGTLPLD